ncbi:MAG: OprD family outer membrane porin [Pontiellaceae bacterium]|nr:OprD family outer membrane porin [Pontiellaceae bacterium]
MNRRIILAAALTAGCAGAAHAQDLAGMVTNGTFKGTIGTYIEANDFANGRDFSWGTGYIDLKAESGRYLRTKFGISVVGHTPLWEESSNGKNYYKVDIEKRFGVSELYTDVLLTDKTALRVGRWANSGTHIDDSHSEGLYVESKEWKNLSVKAGAFRRFAELDYDDGEDFGRVNGAQKLSNLSSDAGDWAFFAEFGTKLQNSKLNPYLYVHPGYAQVYGLDTKTEWETGDESAAGIRLDGYQVFADNETGMNDAWAMTLAPYYTAGPMEFTVGYIAMSGDAQGANDMTKPAWFRDYLPINDQVVPFNNTGAMQGIDSVYGKIKYTQGAFWTHFLAASHNYENSSIGTGSTELELQFGYNLGNGMDVNLRLFDCEFEGTGGSAVDYQKVELVAKYSF